MSFQNHVEVLAAIGGTITADRYIEDIFRLVATAAKTIGSKACALWLLEEDRKTLKLRITHGIREGCPCDRFLSIGQGIQGRVAATQESTVVLNLFKDSYYEENQSAMKVDQTSLMSVPMMTEGRVMGVIDYYTTQPYEFTQMDKHVLSIVASAAARAIANTESMLQSPVIQEELESRKLIERAKDILVAQRGLNGASAYRWIQERSMVTQKSAKEVAAAILMTEEKPLHTPF